MAEIAQQQQLNESDFAKMDVLERLGKVEGMLTSFDPMLQVHMKHIHQTLLTYEELVHVLKDEQIRTLMQGMQQWKGIQLAAVASKAKRVSLKNTTVDDL